MWRLRVTVAVMKDLTSCGFAFCFPPDHEGVCLLLQVHGLYTPLQQLNLHATLLHGLVLGLQAPNETLHFVVELRNLSLSLD